MANPHLGVFEQILLFALVEIGEEAYGVTIKRVVEKRTGQDVSPGGIYVAMERMAARGLVSSRFGESTPERGGRRKKFYSLEPAGAKALMRSYDTLNKMAQGLAPKLAQLCSAMTTPTSDS